ncbi:MAG: sialate O-acetylesterase [Bacteroidales bacterium]|nr:sialate O-acetylesterase [Bacteroidales bacterium]
MKRLFFTILALWLSLSAMGQIRLPSQVGDYMVLQQNTEASLWGWAPKGQTVTVTTSWSEDKYSTKAGEDGSWKIAVPTPGGSFEEKSITVSQGKNSVEIHHVLIGEVWLGSGQSNMQMPLKGFNNCPVEDSMQEIAESGRYKGKIRYSTIPTTVAYTPLESSGDGWKECVPGNSPEFGAAAYFFAKNLVDVLDVPVGIINNAWGGSCVEGWLPREIVSTYEGVPSDPEECEKIMMAMSRPTIMYYGQWAPVRNYTFKGILWYQGESNVGYFPTQYAERMSTLIGLWRKENGNDLPVYMVEIAPYAENSNPDGMDSPILREQQHKVTEMVPDTYIISTADLVSSDEVSQIHPARKKEVGQRLSYLALNHTYGLSVFPSAAITFASAEFDGDRITLRFNGAAENGGFSRIAEIEGLEVCGEDMVWHKAEASVMPYGNLMTAWSEEESEPVAIRYAFRNFRPGNLRSANGLAVPPFRSDRILEGEFPKKEAPIDIESIKGKWTPIPTETEGGLPLEIEISEGSDGKALVKISGQSPAEVPIKGSKLSVPYNMEGIALMVDLKLRKDGKLSAEIVGNPVATLEKAK